MTVTIHGFPDAMPAAHRLAGALGADCRSIDVHSFPDGESLVRVGTTSSVAIIYRSLDHPNAKLIELLLGAAALRDRGARAVILVAPYLGYMRQDKAFQPGEAISQKVIGRLIAGHFDGLVTVDPHLHRVRSLSEAVPGIRVATVSAAATLAAMVRPDITPDTILVGPDAESRPWVESVAAPLGLDVLIGEKLRIGDRGVDLDIPDCGRVGGRPAILVDDMISSGATLLRCAAILKAAGATRLEAIATHCLARPYDLEALARAGIARVRSTDTVNAITACTPIAPAIAEALHGLAADGSWPVTSP